MVRFIIHTLKMARSGALAILLLLTLSSALAGSVVRPTSTSPTAIGALHDKLYDLKANISRIDRALGETTVNHEILLTQLGQVQTSIDGIKKQVDNLHLQSQDENSEYAKQLESLSNLWSQQQNDFNRIKLKNVQLAASLCVENVLSKDFVEARKHFDVVNNDNKIKFIVNQVYNNNNGAKFTLVMTFARGLSKTAKALMVYKALGQEVLRFDKDDKKIDHLSVLISRIKGFGVTCGQPLTALKTERERRATAICVEKILGDRYEVARKIFEMVDSEDKINYIVNQVYNNNNGSKFTLVMTFARGLSKTAKTLKVYKALGQEVLRFDKDDKKIDHLLELISRIESFGVKNGEPLTELKAERERRAHAICVAEIPPYSFSFTLSSEPIKPYLTCMRYTLQNGDYKTLFLPFSGKIKIGKNGDIIDFTR